MEEVIEYSKPAKLVSGNVRKDLSAGSLHGNIRVGRGGNVTQNEECEVMVISDDSNHDVNSCNGLCAAVLPSQDLSKFEVVEKTYEVQNGTSSFETKEFLEEKPNIHKQQQSALNRTSDEYCNSSNKNTIEEVVISEGVEKDDSRGTVDDQGVTSVSSLQYNFDNPLMAMNYMGEFKTPEDNFTKGCKWLVDKHDSCHHHHHGCLDVLWRAMTIVPKTSCPYMSYHLTPQLPSVSIHNVTLFTLIIKVSVP